MYAYGERESLDDSRDVLPASQYLQERLQERRARNTRPKRSRHTDIGPQKGRDDDIFLHEAESTRRSRGFDSSPLAASTRSSDHGSNTRRRPLGVRDMDSQLDRLSKQNFALKLELDHRREQTQRLQEQIESMKAQVERAELLEDEHKELLKINSDMVGELERRDKAVEEAMDIICELEDKVADLEERNGNTRPSTANPDSGYAGTESQDNDPSSSPPQVQPKTPRVSVRPPSLPASAASQRLQGLIDGQTPAKPRREPTVLTQQKPSTNALRSVYMESAQGLRPVKSFQSLLSKQESKLDEDEGLSSPRLSTLSESSFPSLYSPKQHLSPDHYIWEDGDDGDATGSQNRPRVHLRQDSIKRVSQWISERDEAEGTPSKSNQLSAPLPDNEDVDFAPPTRHGSEESQYQSLNNALASGTGKSPDLSQYLDSGNPFLTQARKHRSTQSRPTSFGGPIFGEPLLPPTPDSASTRMLRASRSSIADDRSLLDVTPAIAKGYDALPVPIEPGVRTAPRQMRSSVELRTALASSLEYRNELFDGLRQMDDKSLREDATEADTRSEATRDFGFEDDDYPDGKSIHMGTPRRLLKRAKPPVSGHMLGSETLEVMPHDMRQQQPRRRRSSDQYTNSALKPRLSRVETSPTMLGSLGKMVIGGKKSSAESMTSPHSTRSSSSGNRTIVNAEEQQRRAVSPEALPAMPQRGITLTSPTRSRPSPSPARTLSQKTATLFRRLSNSHGSDREMGPPPALPTSPVTAENPVEVKRPRTSHGPDRPPTSLSSATGQRPPSARETRRPSLQHRTRTEPATARPPSSGTDRASQSGDKGSKGLFKRSNSVRKSEDTAESSTGKNGTTKRRGSLRDAVTTARRPWR